MTFATPALDTPPEGLKLSSQSRVALRDCVETLGDHLKCPICMSVVRDPVSMCCGHFYCKPCVDSQFPAGLAVPPGIGGLLCGRHCFGVWLGGDRSCPLHIHDSNSFAHWLFFCSFHPPPPASSTPGTDLLTQNQGKCAVCRKVGQRRNCVRDPLIQNMARHFQRLHMMTHRDLGLDMLSQGQQPQRLRVSFGYFLPFTSFHCLLGFPQPPR